MPKKYEFDLVNNPIILIKVRNSRLFLSMLNHGFTFRSRIFRLYGDVTITGEGLQKLGLYSALKALDQGGIFIVLHLL
jgi:hypothetical protein